VQAHTLIKKVRITKIIPETVDSRTFVLEPLEGWEPHYNSGQFITLVFYTVHGEKRRSYSISSSIELKEPLSITVKKVDNGEFSRQLVYYAKEGDLLFSSGIGGFFRLPEKPADYHQYFFMAAGSGITPCFSLIKVLLAHSEAQVILIYSNKNPSDTIFKTQLQELQQRYPQRFQLKPLYSSVFNVYESRLSNWLLNHLLDQYLKDPEKTLFYLCGPFEYMRMITITLRSRVFPEQIIKEDFSTLSRQAIPKPPDTNKHMVSLHVQGQVHMLEVQYPLSILATAKKKGIALPYSCEAGRCGSCVANCTHGKVWMAYNEVLTDKEIAEGRILTCQGYPINGDAEIQFKT
jgi:ring-1,2-phenylacetyl-CoA epoxidase subunit PaaE